MLLYEKSTQYVICFKLYIYIFFSLPQCSSQTLYALYTDITRYILKVSDKTIYVVHVKCRNWFETTVKRNALTVSVYYIWRESKWRVIRFEKRKTILFFFLAKYAHIENLLVWTRTVGISILAWKQRTSLIPNVYSFIN